MNPKRLIRWFTGSMYLLALVLISACAQPANGTWPGPQATLMPQFVATAQNAQAGAQATIAAANAAQAEADLAQAYLQVTQTAISLAQFSAASTAEYSTRQTEQAISFTATERSVQSTATQEVRWIEATATTQAELTEAARASATASVIQTATAWPLTATPLAATQIAIVAQAQETEMKAYWRQFVIPFWVFIGAVCLSTFIVLVVLTYRRLIPTVELWLRTRHGPDGETLILLDKDQGVHILQPGRNFGAALVNRAEGVRVDAISPAGAEWQDRVVGREQAVKLARALPGSRQRSAQRLLAQANPVNPPAGPVVEREVIIIPPDDPRVRPLLDEVEPKLLNAGDQL